MTRKKTLGAVRRRSVPTPVRLAKSFRRDGIPQHRIPGLVEETMKEMQRQKDHFEEIERKESRALKTVRSRKSCPEDLKSAISTLLDLSTYESIKPILGVVVDERQNMEVRVHALSSLVPLVSAANKSYAPDAEREIRRVSRTFAHILDDPERPDELKEAVLATKSEINKALHTQRERYMTIGEIKKAM